MKKILLGVACSIIFFSCNSKKSESTATAPMDTTAKETPKKPAAVEFADDHYMDVGRKAMAAFAAGDVDGFLNGYADNAIFNWSSGDSLVGIDAIKKYWKNRRANVIDSLWITNDIWLPIKINTPQKGPDAPGVWLLGWYQFKSKYKNGKIVGGWVHQDFHFNGDGKVDRTVQYIDRAPIVAALAKK